MNNDQTDIRVCSVQFCPVGDVVKAMVDADALVFSQERAAEEAVLLGLLCDLYSLTAALWVVALLSHTERKHHLCDTSSHNAAGLKPPLLPLLHSHQFLVHLCFNVSGEGQEGLQTKTCQHISGT